MDNLILRAVGQVLREALDAQLAAVGEVLKLHKGQLVALVEDVQSIGDAADEATLGLESLHGWREKRDAHLDQTLDRIHQALLQRYADIEGLKEELERHGVTNEDQFCNMTELISEAIEKAEKDNDVLQEQMSVLRFDATNALLDFRDLFPQLMREALTKARPWVHGPPHSPGDIVRHRSGVWAALAPTQEEPGAGQDWNLLLDGIADIRLGHLGELGSFRLDLEQTSGRTSGYTFKVPTIGHVYPEFRSGHQYQYLDIVSTSKGSWIAGAMSPRGRPGVSDDWIQLAARGPEGERGPAGRSPSPNVVAKAYMDILAERPGAVIRQFRGRWEFGKSYNQGDLVMFDADMLLALEDVPSDNRTPIEQRGSWQVFVAGATAQVGGEAVTEIVGVTGF